MDRRRKAMDARSPEGWRPNRDRWVSPTLQAYALMTTSASRGAIRDISQIQRKRP
jgi:dihydroxy-acid dehydratase